MGAHAFRICLLEHGYEVINADIVPPKETQCPFYKVDFENMAQTIELLSAMDFEHSRGVDAIVHLAAIPGPGIAPNETAFRVNTMSTYNIFEAARRLGIRNIVWASSETLLGLPFDEPPPYVPLDEDYAPRPQTGYSLSKFVGEEIAKQFCRWDPELKAAGLRFSNVMEPSDYAAFPSFDRNPAQRRSNLWGYIDARDGAQAIRKSLEAPLKGANVFIIANADTVLSRPNKEVMAEFYPGVPFKRETAPNQTLLSIEKARSVIGSRNTAGAKRISDLGCLRLELNSPRRPLPIDCHRAIALVRDSLIATRWSEVPASRQKQRSRPKRGPEQAERGSARRDSGDSRKGNKVFKRCGVIERGFKLHRTII